MTLSFFLLLVGDVLFGVDYWTDPEISQRFFLLPWLGSALFFALAALHARPATVRMRTVRPLVRSMVVYTPGAHRLPHRLLRSSCGAAAA